MGGCCLADKGFVKAETPFLWSYTRGRWYEARLTLKLHCFQLHLSVTLRCSGSPRGGILLGRAAGDPAALRERCGQLPSLLETMADALAPVEGQVDRDLAEDVVREGWLKPGPRPTATPPCCVCARS